MKHIIVISFLLCVIVGDLRSQDVTFNVEEANGANTGSITAIINDPLFDYSFEWTNSDGNLIVPQPSCNDFDCTLSNLNPGKYCVRITASGSEECGEDYPAEAYGCVDVEGVSCDKDIDWFLEVSDPVCSNSTTGWIQDGSITNNTDPCWSNNGLGFLTATQWMNENGNEQEDQSALKPGKYCRTVFADEDGPWSDCYLYICTEVPALDSEPLTIDGSTGDICYSEILHESNNPQEASWVELVKGFGWIIADASGGNGNKSIRWLDDSSNNWNKIVRDPGVYCAEISDECGNYVIKCWEVIIIYVDQYCLAPYFPELFGSLEFRSGVESIRSSWGSFDAHLAISNDVELFLLNEDINEVKYGIRAIEKALEIGTLELVDGNIAEYRVEKRDVQGVHLNSEEIVVYPNPNNGHFNIVINSDMERSTEVSVFSVDGKLLQTDKLLLSVGRNEQVIDIGHLGKGMYLLRIRDKTPMKIIVNN